MKKVVVFCGLIASGKSFVAKAWAQKHLFPYCNTDVVRKELAALRKSAKAPDGAACAAEAELIGASPYN